MSEEDCTASRLLIAATVFDAVIWGGGGMKRDHYSTNTNSGEIQKVCIFYSLVKVKK